MTFGNHVEHIASDALANGRAETTWLSLRSTYFSEGTPQEGFAAMVQCFAELGVRATSEWRFVNGARMEFIVLSPMHP